MEPDILASAGDPTAVRRHWSDANTVQTEDLPTMETPSDSSRPRLMRLQAVSAHAPAIPRAATLAGMSRDNTICGRKTNWSSLPRPPPHNECSDGSSASNSATAASTVSAREAI